MNKTEFISLISNKIGILDGAMGTQLQKYGMPKGVCTEEWTLNNPDIAKRVQLEYIQSGSDIIYAPTFGANAVKLKNTSLSGDVAGANARLCELSKSLSDKVLVAGDISPLGILLDDFDGKYSFEYCVEVYKEQIKGLVSGGADLLVLETFIDLQEARAAAVAASDVCDLPVISTFAFDENNRLLSGSDIICSMYAMQAAGVSAFGANCGVGPDKMLSAIKALSKKANLPLIAKPNAGMPKIDEQGNTYFDMTPQHFSSYTKEFIKNGVCLIGGCCGTNPEFISSLKAELKGETPIKLENKQEKVLTSSRITIYTDSEYTVSGPIDISSGDIDDIVDEVLDAAEYDVICLAAKKSDIDICRIIDAVSRMVKQPLIFELEDEKLIKAAKRCYCGVSNLG